jgi:hypothetical protein
VVHCVIESAAVAGGKPGNPLVNACSTRDHGKLVSGSMLRLGCSNALSPNTVQFVDARNL